MGREEQGESSSSQNVNISLTAIRRGAKGKDECIFSDGSSFFISRGSSPRLGLVKGRSYSRAQVLGLEHKALTEEVTRRALNLLSFREHSRMQLRIKLAAREYSGEVIEEVLNLLEDEGSLNEERFCRSWIRSRLRKHPEWGRVLVAGLVKAGISMRFAEKIVAEELENEDEYLVLCRAAAGIEKNRRNTGKKLIKKLISRGFSYNQVINYSSTLD